VTTVSPLVLALVAGIGVFGTLAAGLLTMWSAHRIERKRQAFQREQDARGQRAQAMQASRVLDSALMEAENMLTLYVLSNNRLWPDNLAVPDRTSWLELRGGIAPLLEPPAWITVNVGFMALDHMRSFETEYRKLGFDDTTDRTSGIQRVFEPVLRDIRSAREALHPVAYPDHIRLPEGHPMLALLAERKREGR
jgi:hypothetical protein